MSVQEIQNGFETALASRTPFVVRGVANDWPARAWNLRTFDSTFKSSESAQYWYHLPRNNSHSADLPCPPWLDAHWRQGEKHFSLERPIRFWESLKGNTTPWHYDGNAVDVINVQLTGAKRFSLISPKHELPWIRFLPISTLAYEDANLPSLELTLNAGDLIFIPRFWMHRVRALDDTNHNVNWVWTDSAFTADSAVAVREAERLAAIKKLDDLGRLETLLTRHEAGFLRGELHSYAGSQNANLISHMLETVTAQRIDARIDSEMANQSADEFISRLDARGRDLLTRELFGDARQADDTLSDA